MRNIVYLPLASLKHHPLACSTAHHLLVQMKHLQTSYVMLKHPRTNVLVDVPVFSEGLLAVKLNNFFIVNLLFLGVQFSTSVPSLLNLN